MLCIFNFRKCLLYFYFKVNKWGIWNLNLGPYYHDNFYFYFKVNKWGIWDLNLGPLYNNNNVYPYQLNMTYGLVKGFYSIIITSI